MKIIIDYYTKNKSGEPNYAIHHMTFTNDDIDKLIRQKIKENPPVELQDSKRIIDSISIEKVII